MILTDSVTILKGNCIETLKSLPAGSVQTCVTSPPYYGLRDYGTAAWVGGDPACPHTYQKGGRNPETSKGQLSNHGTLFSQYEKICKKCGAIREDDQIGLEETPEKYIENLLKVFREVWRVLAEDGTLWLNLGDSYNGSGKGNVFTESSAKQATNRGANISRPMRLEGLKPKDLIGIPWAVAFAMRADGWYLRSDIIWAKPNPMPESVTDRPTKSHEYIFLFSKSQRYYYDYEAVLEPVSGGTHSKVSQEVEKKIRLERENGEYKGDSVNTPKQQAAGSGIKNNDSFNNSVVLPVTERNKRSVWTVTTKPYKGAHFATFPPDLIEPCILAGTSEKGQCPECGRPWVKTIERTRLDRTELNEDDPRYRPNKYNGAYEDINGKGDAGYTQVKATGWTPQCSHNLDPIPQTVLDPFNGSGTTGAVSLKHNRRYIGCELNPEYINLTEERFNKVQYLMPGLA